MLLRPTGRVLWSFAVYLQDRPALPPAGAPAFLFSSLKWRVLTRNEHTLADPFLVNVDGKLWVLYEAQNGSEPGRIEAAVLDGTRFVRTGVVLREPFHLSYPAVLPVDGTLYLMPEAGQSGGVQLYRFTDFPHGLVHHRILLAGRFVDPSAVKIGDTWFLFVTQADRLLLYFTEDIVNGELHLHPASPITDDPTRSRCGGMPFHLDGQLVRPAQNGSVYYGRNLSLMRIDRIDREDYQESPMAENVFTGGAAWNRGGGHHVSMVPYEGGVAVAVDGQCRDHLGHHILSRLRRMMSRP